MCTLIREVRSRWDLDCNAFGDPDAGHTFTVAGVLFGFVPAPPGAIAIDGFSMSHTTAITNAINLATEGDVKACDDDGQVHLYGPPGMLVTADCPGVVAVLIEAGSEARCDP